MLGIVTHSRPMVNGEVRGRTIVEENKITQNGKSKCVVNKFMEKSFKFDYDKRVIGRISSDHRHFPVWNIIPGYNKVTMLMI